MSHLTDHPFASELVGRLQKDEAGRQVDRVDSARIKMSNTGHIATERGEFTLSRAAMGELAKLCKVPAGFFAEVDPDLRSHIFNHQFRRLVADNTSLTIVRNDSGITHVAKNDVLPCRPSCVVESILREASPITISNGIHSIEYAVNDRIDVSLVSTALQTEPRPGDIAYGGIHLSIDPTGTIQVGPAIWRLVCQNGALARECANGKHRIRRGSAVNSEATALNAVRQFARQSWASFERMASGLRRLANEHLEDAQAVIYRLRERPFFISAGAAKRVQRQLVRESQDEQPTLYDLFNAITSVGTHDEQVLQQYRFRLRLGAGALTRGRTGVCNECGRWSLATLS